MTTTTTMNTTQLYVEIPIQENTGNGAAMREVWQRVPAKLDRKGNVLIETNRGWSQPASYRAICCQCDNGVVRSIGRDNEEIIDDCHECGGEGGMDSGGVAPWGASIAIPCPSCRPTNSK
jgi:hypothetical protein